MTGVPTAILPVINEIRKHVPRPKELPTLEPCGSNDNIEALRWVIDGEKCCPMGMLPYALSSEPFDEYEIDVDCPFSIPTMRSFAAWWDEQKDPWYAFSEVWGFEQLKIERGD